MDDCSIEQPLFAGRYALYSRLASGGMASVYLGRLLGRVGFRRTVAVKRLHAHFAGDPEFRAMFLDEARLAARIRHPNVVPTLDIVSTNDELFLVMEYIDGESLSALVRRLAKNNLRLPMPVISAIVCDLLAGLHAAHEAQGDHGEPLSIVHRDVSPQNVLVGSDGVARVLDFGVAKAIGNAVQTRDGQIKGKLAYMAPEQVSGSSPLNRAADIYAASVVLWELGMNRRLWAAENEAALVSKMVAGEIPPARTAVNGGTPALDAVIMKGLSLDPGQRYPSARDMARALERAFAPATHQSVADWFAEVAGDGVAKRRDVLSRIESVSSRVFISSQPPTSSDSLSIATPAGQQDIVPRPPQNENDVPALEVDLSHLTPSSVSSLSGSAAPTTTTSPTVLTRRRMVWPLLVGAAVCTAMLTIGLLLIIHSLFPSRLRHAEAKTPPSVTALASVRPTPPATSPITVAEPDAPPTAEPSSISVRGLPAAPAPHPRPVVAAPPPRAATTPAAAAAPPPPVSRPAAAPSAKPNGPSIYSRD